MTYEKAIAEARKIGEQHGTAGGTWVVDGNTTSESLRAIMDAVEAGEFYDRVDISAPLSGEWADGYSVEQLFEDAAGRTMRSIEDGDYAYDLATAYEDAYYEAFEAEAFRSAQAMLPDEEDAR